MKATISNPWTFITLCLALPVTVYSAVKFYSVLYEKLPVYQRVEGTGIRDFVDQHNTQVTDILPGRVTVVNFFFTSCPVICPKMMKNMKRVHDRYADDSEIRFVSVSVDPERDTPQRMPQYITRMKINDAQWQLISGSRSAIYALARNQFSLVAASANDEGDFIHSDKMILVDGTGNIRGYYTGIENAETDRLINDINKLTHESPDHVAR